MTRKMLLDWAGEKVLRDAETLVDNGLVLEAAFDGSELKGAILRNGRALRTSLRVLPGGMVENRCPCYDNRERGLICTHVTAIGVVLVRRATDPQRDAKYAEEMRRASRLAGVDETAYIRRAPPGTPGALAARLRLTVGAGWLEGFQRGAVPIVCEVVCQDRALPLDRVPRDLPLLLSKQDEAILFVLEDISGGPAAGRAEVGRADLLNLIHLHAGSAIHAAGHPPIVVNQARVAAMIGADLDRESGALIVSLRTELPFLRPGESARHLVSGRTGWAYGAGNLWPLERLLPAPYHRLYEEPVTIGRQDVLRFLSHELPELGRHAAVRTELSLDLFTVEPAEPEIELAVAGSPASLSATLLARYGDRILVAGKPDPRGDFAEPDPEDLLRYTTRNLPRERAALERLGAHGMRGECGDALSDVVGAREVLNFLGGVLPGLRRAGWRVTMQGRLEPFGESLDFVAPVVRVDGERGEGWFDVGFGFEDPGGASISAADVQLAIRKGDAFITRGGRTLLLDTAAIESMQSVFADCASGESDRAGHFRLADVHAAYVKSSLDALDGVDVEDTPGWRARAECANRVMRIEPVPLGEPMESALRLYQKEGVYWLRFLEANGFCGLLADEMGLGKTIQTLAWLRVQRHVPAARGLPALIVCPTSIVGNWAEEAARFAPGLRVLALSGAERHGRWEELPRADLAITSYALLRRDLERYLEQPFSAVVLDEAQHIKNRSTQNAVAAKRLRAHNRLVLTGTPVENSVSDLWSIMDFLMPGYLGGHDPFRERYERPIARGGEEADAAQRKLRRKLQPFLLRRLKKQVARELPDKIERVAFCDASPDQQVVYNGILAASRDRIGAMVRQRGFNRCRMEILATLLRLRQVCCHLELLKLPDLKAQAPSAKMDLFLELLDEAVDGGHRVLVFSQFVSMLQILRRELDARGLTQCYLDGSTTDRLSVVHRFNTQRDVPVFLISLKAGGSGLNLTGADMVIHFDPWWNPAVEDQATARAHRIGQKRTVYSVKLITRNTVEEKVLALQQKKKSVIDATVESDEQVMQSMTWEDVQELLAV